MAKKNTAPKFVYLEKWNTRYGIQERVVTRQNGRFVDSTPALSTLRHGVPVESR